MKVLKNRTVSKLAEKARTFHERFVSHVPWGARARRQAASKNWKIRAPEEELNQARSAARLRDPLGASTPIFFLVGYQKSGTTWLMKMLDSHPEILCQGEGRPFGRDWRQEHLKRRSMSYPPTSLYNAMLSAEDLRFWIERSIWSKEDDADKHLVNLTGLAIEYFLTQRLLKTGKKLVGDKTVLLNPEIVREIGTICPEAKVIHIIRDGRDATISAMHQRWNHAEDQGGSIKITPEQIAKREAYRNNPQELLSTDDGMFPEGFVRKSATRWSARVSRTMRDGPTLFGANYVEVRYEDLLENSKEELGRLLVFLGADAREQVVSRCVSAATFETLSGGRKRGQEASSFYRKGIAGDWRNVFTEKNKQEFKAVAGDLLVRLGYEKDNDW